MLAVQPRSDYRGHEELRSVGVRSSVGHRQKTRFLVSQSKVLVTKLLPIDRFPACSVVSREISTLQHESRNNSVERRPLISESMLASGQLTKVARRLRNNVVEQLEHYSSGGSRVDSDVKKDI